MSRKGHDEMVDIDLKLTKFIFKGAKIAPIL